MQNPDKPERTRSSQRYTTLSLFSGIGGIDLGFEEAGFNVVAMVEINHDSCETLRANSKRYFANGKIIEGDIRKLSREQIFNGRVDFIIGGPPCQTFSAIGRRAGGAMGTLDPRGTLFEHYCRLLEAFKPEGFLFENVRGIISSDAGRDWRRILDSFRMLGYTLKYRLLDAAGYGVPQHRERIILIGFKQGNFKFPRPTHGPDASPPVTYFTPEMALKGLQFDKSCLFQKGGKYDHLLPDIPPGQNYLFYTREMGHPRPCFAWRSKFSDFLYKANPNQPVKTLVARLGRYSGPFHWEGRRMHISEFKRLQGFPDDFIITGSETAQLRQIGDSVPPPLSYQLARAVRQTLFHDDVGQALMDDAEALSFDERKAIKARRTRRFSETVSRQSSGQLGLFDSNCSYSTPVGIVSQKMRQKLELSPVLSFAQVSYLQYTSSAHLDVLSNPGKLTWKLEKESRGSNHILFLAKRSRGITPGSISVKIDFLKGVIQNVDSLIVELHSVIPEELFAIWDAVNLFIRRHSSYPSIHELYGHFTEPKPAFRLSASCSIAEPWPPEVKLLMWFSDFQKVNQLFPLNLLSEFGFGFPDESNEWLRRLREMRFDIRTHATNMTIPEGLFRCCYPFTLPIDRRSYVTIA